MKNKIVQQTDNTHNSSTECFSISVGRLIMQFKRLERYPRTYGAAGRLTQSEIHTIDAIGCGDGILMSELAARLGVTKGAVTQIISRLEVKEFVRRVPYSADSRAIIVSLTKKGILAHQAHQELHKNFYRKLCTQLTPQEIEIFRACVEKLCEVLQE